MRTESLLCPKCSMAFFSRSCRCPASAFFAVASIALARLLAAHACQTSRTPTTQNPMVCNTSYFSFRFNLKSSCKPRTVSSEYMTSTASAARSSKMNMKKILSICFLKRCHNFEIAFFIRSKLPFISDKGFLPMLTRSQVLANATVNSVCFYHPSRRPHNGFPSV